MQSSHDELTSVTTPNFSSLEHRTGKVLVIGSEHRMMLPIIRSLGRKDLQVHVAWCPPGNITLRSRYIHKTHPIPAFADGDDAWLLALQKLLKSQTFDLVIPATEEAVFPMHQTREVWEKYPSVWLLNDKAFKFAFNKVKIYDLATSLGIPIPRTIVLDQTVNITDNLSDIPLPTIVKPICSVNTEDLKNKNYVRCLSTREDLLGYIHDLIRQQAQVAIQEVVPGRGVGIEVLASNGKILYAFQHQRLHETSGFGSTYRKSVQLEPHLVEATSRLLSALDYTGVAMVEFRVDDASGHWVLLEINARFWGSLPLAVAAGADFPYYLYQLLVDGKQHFPPDYRLNVYSRQFLDDFRWIWRTLSSNGQEGREAGWEINPISTRQLVADVWRALTFRDHIDTFVWDDPGPFTGELRQTLALAISRFLPRKNTTL